MPPRKHYARPDLAEVPLITLPCLAREACLEHEKRATVHDLRRALAALGIEPVRTVSGHARISFATARRIIEHLAQGAP